CCRSRRPPTPTLFPYTTLFRSRGHPDRDIVLWDQQETAAAVRPPVGGCQVLPGRKRPWYRHPRCYPGERGRSGAPGRVRQGRRRSEEHTSELQSRENLVCRLLL